MKYGAHSCSIWLKNNTVQVVKVGDGLIENLLLFSPVHSLPDTIHQSHPCIFFKALSVPGKKVQVKTVNSPFLPDRPPFGHKRRFHIFSPDRRPPYSESCRKSAFSPGTIMHPVDPGHTGIGVGVPAVQEIFIVDGQGCAVCFLWRCRPFQNLLSP